MFRLLRLIFALILAIVIAVGIYLWAARVPMLEKVLSRHLHTKVTIEAIQLGWGSISLEGLRIHNPSQSTLPYAFQSDEIKLEMSPFKVLEKRLRITRLTIQNPIIGLEFYNSSGSDNNWVRLINGLSSAESGRTFVVNKLIVTNLQFEVMQAKGKQLSIPAIPYLEFDNLGEKGALTLSQLGRVIIQTILYTLTNKAHLGAILDNMKALPKNLIEGVTATVPIEETKGMIQEGLDTIRRKTHEASEFLRDLFSSQ